MSEHPEQLPFHPITAQYPLMEGAEFENLCESVKEYGGLEYPIHLWHGQVIDGRNRYRACLETGVDPLFVDDSDIPEEELPAHLRRLNEDRRHLTTDFLKERRKGRIGRVAEKRKAGASLRSIAEEEGVSEAQVRADLQAATAQGCAVDPEGGKVKGKDRKTRPARRKKTTPTANGQATAHPCAVQSTDTEGTQSEPAAPVDEVGIPVPPDLVPVFTAREKFHEIRLLLRKIQAALSALALSEAGAHLRKELSYREKKGKPFYRSSEMETLAYAAKTAAPHSAVCPWCYDEHPGTFDRSCKACFGTGWVPRGTWERAPEDYREAVLKLAKAPPSEESKEDAEP